MLDETWERYADHLSSIEEWKDDEKNLRECLTKVKALLGYNEPIDLVVVYFVVGFENNPFVAPYDQNRKALCLPVENGDSEIFFAHELTNIVHTQTGDLTGEGE